MSSISEDGFEPTEEEIEETVREIEIEYTPDESVDMALLWHKAITDRMEHVTHVIDVLLCYEIELTVDSQRSKERILAAAADFFERELSPDLHQRRIDDASTYQS